MEEVRGAPPGPFPDLEVIRQDAAMPISRFTALLGIPRRTYTRWFAAARAGNLVKGPWPAPAVEAIEAVVEKYAAAWPAWGHRKIAALMRADGHPVSVSTVERAMRRRGLLQPRAYQAERRELAQARKAAFAEPPTGPLQVWQLDFSDYETSRGGIWRIAGCADYYSKYEFGWHLATTCNALDAEMAVRVAIAEGRTAGRPVTGRASDRPRHRPPSPDQAGHRQRRRVQGRPVRGVHRLPTRTPAHPHPPPLTRPERRPGARLRVAEVRASLPHRDPGRAEPGDRGRGLPADLQHHPPARGAGHAPPDRGPPTRSTNTTFDRPN